MFCKNCGNRIPDESNFCPFCMNNINDEPKKKPNNVILILIAMLAVILIAFFVIFFLTKDKAENEVSSHKKEAASQSEIADESSGLEIPSSETTFTTTTTTTTAPLIPERSIVYNAYTNYIKSWSYGMDSYYLYDIDADGVDELILKTGSFEGNYEFNFYTYTDEVKYLGTASGGHGGLAIPKSGDGIIVYQERQGHSSVTQINKQGESFITNRIIDDEYGSYFDVYCEDIVPNSNSLY